MAIVQGIGISGMITPGGDDNNKFATHSDRFGKGGYRAVQDIDERDAITYDRRALGMEVRVLTGEGAGVYYLKSFDGSSKKGVTAQEWELVTTPSSGDSGGGEKEVFFGTYNKEDGSFSIRKNDGTIEIATSGTEGVIYLDTTTGLSYFWSTTSLASGSFKKINASLSWSDVDE